jgi:hypothetical protein
MLTAGGMEFLLIRRQHEKSTSITPLLKLSLSILLSL